MNLLIYLSFICAFCTITPITSANYHHSSNCPPGFEGDNCEVNIDDCARHVCQNNATCIDGIGTYTCQCPPQYTGTYCTKDVDECFLRPNQCRNGATCVNHPGGYSCICVNGWTGPDCSENIDDCASAYCQNGATCHDRVGTFYCECPPGKTGLLCQLDDACINNPCKSGAICDTSPIDGTYMCSCKEGFTGIDCTEDINECEQSSSPCEHGGICVNTPGSFKCDCPVGFTGSRCEININECDSSPCQNDGTCLDERGKYRCICMQGFTGDQCETEINECGENPCLNGGTCTDLINAFRCVCPTGFSGNRCEQNENDCLHSPCLNGGTCVDGIANYTCYCPSGFIGKNCATNVDDCSSSPCHHGKCVDEINGFKCLCDPGYTGILCSAQVNECLTNPCLYGGTCHDLVNGFECECPKGTSGQRCEINADECWNKPCQNGAICHDKLNSFTCQCPAGFSGRLCEINIDDCYPNPCANNGICSDLINGFKCSCPPGFHGNRCLNDIDDECTFNPCINGGSCETNPSTGFTCHCPLGFTGLRCESYVDECASSPCLNSGTCYNRHNGYRCVCPAGFTGKNCEVNVDDCASNLFYGGPACLNGGRCYDQVNNFTCVCPSPYTGRRCEVEINPCLHNRCRNGGTCSILSNLRDYKCTCSDGFMGFHCEHDINECKSPLNPCRNNATCVNTHGSYECRCPLGYEGRDCLIDVDECESRPCLNGGSCIDEVASFKCICLSDFSGRNCEINIRDIHHHRPTKDPWASCPDADFCSKNFQNGICNSQCNIRGCLYDGYDCEKRLPSRGKLKRCDELDNPYCLANYGNGYCDKGCDNEECGWDGGDCDGKPTDYWTKRGIIEMIVDMPSSDYARVSEFMREISRLTNMVVRVRINEQNQPDIVPILGTNMTKLSLVMDNSKCHSACLEDSSAVAQFLTATIDSKRVHNPFLDHLKRIDSINDVDNQSHSDPWFRIMVVCGLLFCASVLVFLGAIKTKTTRNKAKGITWFPDGFSSAVSGSTICHGSAYGRNVSTFAAAGGDFVGRGQHPKLGKGGRISCGKIIKNDGQELSNLVSLKSQAHSLASADNKGNLIYEEPADSRSWSVQHYEAYGDPSNPDCTISVNGLMTPPLITNDHGQCMPMDGVDIIGPGGLTPLMIASTHRNSTPYCGTGGDVDMALIDADLDPNGANIIQDLLSQGADINRIAEKTGETSLHLAARHSRADAAKRLIDSGADCNAPDSTGRSPLHAAIAADARGVFELLKQHRATNLNARTYDGTTPLILAARLSCEGMLSELIQAEADVNACDDKGKTALHWAASVNNIDAVRLLLRNGANRDAQDHEEATPLFLAAREGSFQAVRVLLEHHANKDITDHMDRLPRDVAAEKMHSDIVELLDTFKFTPTNQDIKQESTQQSPQQANSTATTKGSSSNQLTSHVNGSNLPASPSSGPPAKKQATSQSNVNSGTLRGTKSRKNAANNKNNTSNSSNNQQQVKEQQNLQFCASNPSKKATHISSVVKNTSLITANSTGNQANRTLTSPNNNSQQLYDQLDLTLKYVQNQTTVTPVTVANHVVSHTIQQAQTVAIQSPPAHQLRSPQPQQQTQQQQQLTNLPAQSQSKQPSIKSLPIIDNPNVQSTNGQVLSPNSSEHYHNLNSPPILPPPRNSQSSHQSHNYEYISLTANGDCSSSSPQHIVMLSPPHSYSTNQSPLNTLMSPATPVLLSPPHHQPNVTVMNKPPPAYDEVIKSQRSSNLTYLTNTTNNDRSNQYNQQTYHTLQTVNCNPYSVSSETCYLTPSPDSPSTWSTTTSPPSASDWNDVHHYQTLTLPSQQQTSKVQIIGPTATQQSVFI